MLVLRRRIYPYVLWCMLFCCSIVFCACSKETSGKIEREHLFSLTYGNFEDQFNIFQLESSYVRPDSQLVMSDGIFYISNASAGKVLKLTSFGDLLALYYDPERNPPPSGADTGHTDKIMTRRAVKYPLNHPTYLAVTTHKHLFIVDSVAEQHIEYDQTENLALRDIVIHFNEAGEYIDTLGQEGVGGTPFPPIEGIYTNAANGIIVVCRTGTGVRVYWYDSAGSLLYKVPIALSSLPSPYTGNEKVFLNLDKAIPAFTTRKLYIKVDYYREDIDSETNVSAGISYDKSCLYTFNLEDKRYEQAVDIAPYEDTEETDAGVGHTKHCKKVYGLLGITDNHWCLLMTPYSEGYVLELIDLYSNKIYTRTLSIAENELVYHAFHLSSDGILSALLAGDTQANIVWWKTSGIIGAANNE